MQSIETVHIAGGIGAVQRVPVPFGSTVEEIAFALHGTIEGLTAWVQAPPGHHSEYLEIPRALWRSMKPKASGVVVFGYRLGRSVFRSILGIAATVAAIFVAPFLAPILLPGLSAGIATPLIAAGLGIGASIALNALFPAAQPSAPELAFRGGRPEERARQFSNVESDSNILAKEAALPIVVGERRISPPEIASPLITLDTGVQTVRRLFALDGHHAISDVQVDRVPVEDFDSITTQTRDGAELTPVDTFVTRISRFNDLSRQLSTFNLDETNLIDQENPSISEPRWERFRTAFDPRLEEITIRLQLDSFARTDSATQRIRVPVQVRFRRTDDPDGTWINLPEIHFTGRDISTVLQEIRVRWDGQFGEGLGAGSIRHQFFGRVPASDFTVSNDQTGDQWEAHPHFLDGEGLRDVKNITGRRYSIAVQLDQDVIPRGEFEWEIRRGQAMNIGSLNASTYQISGSVFPLFRAYTTGTTWRVRIDQGALISRLNVAHATSIVRRAPCGRPKTALLALQSRGASVKNITVRAARFVHDWDGTGWNTLTTTKNPAVHYRQILHDYLAYHRISTDLINNADFIGWRDECEARGYEVSGVFAGISVRDALEQIATAGYARPRYSDGYGVDWFRDRTAQRPVQGFSPRNANITVEWVSGERPVGIRASFQNEEAGYRDDELQVNNPLYANFGGYDVREYQSITNPRLIRRRAMFDLLQAYFQGRRAWVVEAPIEGAICERGDLVSVVSDLNDDSNSGARIRRVINATTFTIDQLIPAQSTNSIFAEGNIFAADQVFDIGLQSVCLVSTPTGTEMRTITAAEDDVIRVDEPFSSTDLEGAHIVIGPVTRFTSRCIVSEVQRQSEERARLVLVDEAPEIHQILAEEFGS